jgi:hypothetical protein
LTSKEADCSQVVVVVVESWYVVDSAAAFNSAGTRLLFDFPTDKY